MEIILSYLVNPVWSTQDLSQVGEAVLFGTRNVFSL